MNILKLLRLIPNINCSPQKCIYVMYTSKPNLDFYKALETSIKKVIQIKFKCIVFLN